MFWICILPRCTNSFLCFLAYPTMEFGDPLPGSANLLPPPEPRAPALAAPIKRFPMSTQRPSATPAPRSSDSLAPTLPASSAYLPAVRGSIRPPAPSSPAPRLNSTSTYLYDLPASALHSSVAPETDTYDWGAVLDPPPPAPLSTFISGLV